MRIILQEMKKIFHPVMLLLLVVINGLMYYIFIDFDISVFPNGRPATDLYNIGIEMVEKYGHELDEEEFADFKLVYEQEIKKADEFIQSDQEFAELGITSYEQFIEMRSENINETTIDKLSSRVIFEEEIDLFWEIPQRKDIIEKMKNVHKYYGYGWIEGEPTKKQEQRIQEVINSGEVNSLFPSYPVEYNFETISKSIATTIILSVLFMISPIFIRDYKNNMVGLQYTSKAGRSLFKKKITAGMLSAFIITTFLTVVYYSLYSTNDIGMFLKTGVNSFLGYLYWYDFTFLQLIIVTILVTYGLSLSIALLAIFVSSICKNYISVIGILLPIFAVVYLLIQKPLMPTEAFKFWWPQWGIGILFSIVIILPIIAIIWKINRVRKQDVLD